MEAVISIQQQEGELNDHYINHMQIRRTEEQWWILLDIKTFMQGLKSELLKNILKIKNSVTLWEVIHKLQEYSKTERKMEDLYGSVARWSIKEDKKT